MPLSDLLPVDGMSLREQVAALPPNDVEAILDGIKEISRVDDYKAFCVFAKLFFPYKLLPFQKAILKRILAKKADGTPKYYRLNLIIPRKNFKTTLLAMLGLYKALIWFNYKNANIPVGSNSGGQSALMIEEIEKLVFGSGLFPDPQADKSVFCNFQESPTKRVKLFGGCMIHALPKNAAASHGKNVCYGLLDEMHGAAKTDLFTTIESATQMEAQAQILMATTVGYDKRNSPLGRLWKKVVGEHHFWNGEERNVDKPSEQLTFIWSNEGYDVDIADRDAWIRANPAHELWALGLDGEIRKASTKEAHDVLRWQLNVWVSQGGSAWLKPGQFEKTVTDIPGLLDDAPFCVGFDGSRSGDATVITVASIPVAGEKTKIWVHEAWERPHDDYENLEWSVPSSEVLNCLVQLCSHPNFRLLRGDIAYYDEMFTTLERSGFNVEDMSSQNPKTSKKLTKQMTSDVKEQTIEFYDPTGILEEHFGNSILYHTKSGSFFTKEHPSSNRLIDAAYSAGCARSAVLSFDSAPTIEFGEDDDFGGLFA